MMSDSATKALMKIAGSVGKKVPEMGEKYLTVCGAKKHVRDYARAKENEWANTGLFEAAVEMLYYMHETCDELIEKGENMDECETRRMCERCSAIKRAPVLPLRWRFPPFLNFVRMWY